MKPRDRALCAFKHREADRVPVFEINVNSPIAEEALGHSSWVGTGGRAWVQQYGEMISAGMRDEFVDGLALDTIELAQIFDWDIVVAPFCPGNNPIQPSRLNETTWRYEQPESGVWYVMTYLPETDIAHQADHSFCHDGIAGLRRYVEWKESQILAPDEGALDVTRMVVEACSGDRLVFVGWYDIPGAIDQAWLSLYFRWLLHEPKLMARYFEIEATFLELQVTKAADLGAEGVICATDLAGQSGPVISPTLSREMILPHFKRLVNACHREGLLVIKHTDGDVTKLERDLLVESGIDGYHSIDPSAGMNLEEMKARHGDRLILCGNVDVTHILPWGKPEEIRREVLRCLGQGAQGGGYVLSSSNSLHSQIPLSNYQIMLDTAREFGRYPIQLEAGENILL